MSAGTGESEHGPVGVYVHLPFCSSRCAYCDFTAVSGRSGAIGAYLAALEVEVQLFQREAPGTADTVFVGGGTPSLLAAEEVGRVLAAVRNRFVLERGAEITVEGNPETLSAECLEGWARAGVTRVCVGIQSLDDAVLDRVGRGHDGGEALEALRRSRRAGFLSVAADLICGLPGEDLETWGETVHRVVDEGPDHVSVYLLETDKDTPLSRGLRDGRIAEADEDALAAAYEASVEILEGASLPLYEISNFAREGHASRHNLKYWSDRPYAGFGAGSHAYLSGARRANLRDLNGYLDRLGAREDPVEWREPSDAPRRASEAAILGLRRVEGVDVPEIERRYGVDLLVSRRDAWERAEEAGLVVASGGRVRLTSRGRLRSNELFMELL